MCLCLCQPICEHIKCFVFIVARTKTHNMCSGLVSYSSRAGKMKGNLGLQSQYLVFIEYNLCLLYFVMYSPIFFTLNGFFADARHVDFKK